MTHQSVHENWAPNLQATAVCDFCNRKNIPLQKCHDCNINICRQCTSQGMLENDTHHMLARGAANSFHWHTWGKDKKTKHTSHVHKTQATAPVNNPDPELSTVQTVTPPSLGGHGECPPPDGRFQYSTAPYAHHPLPAIYNQQYIYGPQGLQPVGFLATCGQYQYSCGSQIPQHPSFLPPYGLYGAPLAAGQRVYSNYVAQQQPQHNTQLSSERSPQLSQALALPARSGDMRGPSQAPSGQPSPSTPVLPSTSTRMKATRNDTLHILAGQPSTRQAEHAPQRSKQASIKQSVPRAPTTASQRPSAARNNLTPKPSPRHAPAASRQQQAVRGSKRPREVPEDTREQQQHGSHDDVRGPAHRPAKRSRRE